MDIAKLIDSGGAVALAVVIWWELRQFRRDMVHTMDRLADQHTAMAEKQIEIAKDVAELKRLAG